jgi:FeS assembly SUF system protein
MDGQQKTEEREVLKTAVEALDAPPVTPSDDGANAVAETSSEAPLPAASTGLSSEEIDRLTNEIVAALKTVYDPEIPADIYELGLIYKVEIDDDRNVVIDMTLTAPGCPVAGEMPIWVENAVNAVPGIAHTKVNVVFTPPWDQSRMSDEARLAVGMF